MSEKLDISNLAASLKSLEEKTRPIFEELETALEPYAEAYFPSRCYFHMGARREPTITEYGINYTLSYPYDNGTETGTLPWEFLRDPEECIRREKALQEAAKAEQTRQWRLKLEAEEQATLKRLQEKYGEANVKCAPH